MTVEQLAIEFGETHRAHAAWVKLLQHCRDIAEIATIKEVAYRCDIKPSQMSAALTERERNYFRAEWLPVFLLLANEGQRAALLGDLAGLCGYEVTRKRTLTTAERLARLEAVLRSEFGAAGEQLIAKVDR